MANEYMRKLSIGWIGAGRMGYSMAFLLLQAGCDVSIWNRTRSKAEPLIEHGAKVVDSPAALAGCDVIFTMVGGPDDTIVSRRAFTTFALPLTDATRYAASRAAMASRTTLEASSLTDVQSTNIRGVVLLLDNTP